jgi:hypothetical protein
MGVTEALAHFSAKSRNRRSIWSGRSADGKTVVLVLWQDLIDGRTHEYNDFARADDEPAEEWTHLPGNHERIENLKWAQEHCDGYFRVVIAISKDRSHRTVDDCFPVDRWQMRIEAMDDIGRLRATQVPV